MSLIDSLKSGATSIANRASSAVDEVATKASEVKQQVVETAQAGLERVATKVDDVGHKLDKLTGGAHRDAGVHNTNQELAKVAASKLKEAGSRASQAGRALANEAKKHTGPGEVGIHNANPLLLKRLFDKAVGTSPEDARAQAQQHLEKIVDSVDGANVPRQIDHLKDGERTTMYVEVQTPQGVIKKKLEVRRQDEEQGVGFGGENLKWRLPRYVVSVEGSLGAGPQGESLGMAAGGGGKQELAFRSAADARRAIQIMGQIQGGGGLRGDGGIGSASEEDVKWLAKHTSSVELKAGVQAEAGFDTGFGVLSAKGAGSGEVGVQLQYENGEPARVVVRARAERSAQGQHHWGGASAQGTESIEVEESYPLPQPPPPDLMDRLKDPARRQAALDELKRAGPPTTKVKLSREGKGSLAGKGGRVESSYEVELTPEKARKVAEAWSKPGSGVKGALDELGETRVKVTQTSYETKGVEAKVKVPIIGVGGDAGTVTEKVVEKKESEVKAKDLSPVE